MSAGALLHESTAPQRRDANRRVFWDTFPARRPTQPAALLDALLHDHPDRELTANQLAAHARRVGIRIRRARRIASTNGWKVL